MDFIQGLIQFLESLSQDPFLYSVVFFIYAVAATTFLPIPVEVGLFFSPETPIVVKALVLGAGKAVGSVLVFTLGGKVSNGVYRLMSKSKVLSYIMRGMQWFVFRTRYVGLYLILSIPLMVDTLPIYIFSLFNQEGAMNLRYFALTNFLAGITRAFIVYAIFLYLGLKLV
ncbi:MAG: hypothetical protein ISF22_09570 [Methanomassiliicoccus sp.]|nr:hypothetical protein [Methanomassiliicoccus sp.]